MHEEKDKKITQEYLDSDECLLECQPSSHHIMVVDDDRDIRELMEITIKSKGHHCTVVPDGEAAISLMRECQPEVVITDVEMPNMDGIELTKRIKAEFTADVIVVTGLAPQHAYAEFIEIGASDFVRKPVTPSEIIARLERVLKERCLKAESMSAHQKLVAAHEALQASYLDTIHRLVVATEYKDEETGDHIVRIGRLSALLAKRLGLPDRQVKNIGFASPMHDIGKIGIPDHILLKPGRLTAEEFEIMKTHATIGAKILSKSKSDIIRCAQQIAVSHHERWDGSGYPQGLIGERIPLTGRIVALADTFDALTSRRPYKEPYPLEQTLDIMQASRGNHFDPDLLDLFMENIDDILAIKKEVQDIAPGQLGSFLLSARDWEALQTS
jgi:putative two-component system response regulator